MTATVEAPAKTATLAERNVYQRKLAVMEKCDVLSPDAMYGSDGSKVHFPYLSVQYISNHIRRFCCEEGLDCTVSVEDEQVVVRLTNVDNPDDSLYARWPLVPQDKAWAYSTKYALIRTFLIGDATEGDEAENAERSGNGQRATTAAPVARKTPPANLTPRGRKCEQCAVEDWHTSSGGTPAYWLKDKGPHVGQYECNGRTPDGGYANHLMPVPDSEVIRDDTSIPFVP